METRMNVFPKCIACRTEFRLEGPVPYLLPCHHDLCGLCLTSVPEGSDINCFLCNSNHKEKTYPKNVVRQRDVLDLTIRDQSTELMCSDASHSDRKMPAVSWCQNCEKLVCILCQTLHGEEDNMHNLFKIPKYPTEGEVTTSASKAIPRIGESAIAHCSETSRAESTTTTTPPENPDISDVANDRMTTVEICATENARKSSLILNNRTETEKKTMMKDDLPPTESLEREINEWKQNCTSSDEMKRNMDEVLTQVARERKLVLKLLAEKQDHEKTLKELTAKQKKLQDETKKQCQEIEYLKNRTPPKARRNPKVVVQVVSPIQTLPVDALASQMCQVLAKRNIQMTCDFVLKPLSRHVGPLLVLCVNVSRLGTDVTQALSGVTADQDVAVVVLHHKDIHVLPRSSSEKTLSGQEFRNLGAIIDMAFWKHKGLYKCDINDDAIFKLADFVAKYAKP